MNYDEIAQSIVRGYINSDYCIRVLTNDIAAALRRAANEAARDGYEGGREFERADTSKQAMALKHELTAKYGPKEARDE